MREIGIEPVLQRILDKLQERGLTGKQLEAHLNLTNGSVTKWKIRNGKSYFRHIVEIADFLGTTPSYLLSGNMINLGDLTEEEKNFMIKFRTMNEQEKRCIFDIVENFSVLNQAAQSARLACSMSDGQVAQS